MKRTEYINSKTSSSPETRQKLDELKNFLIKLAKVDDSKLNENFFQIENKICWTS